MWPFKKRDSETTKALSLVAAPVPAITKPAGSDGVVALSGYLYSGERDARMTGTQKWVAYDNTTLNVAIVGSAMNIWTKLGGSAKWTAKANPRGGKDAERAVEIVTEGLLEAQMSMPWRACVRRQLMKSFRGFALHEAIIRRRPDGMVVYGDLQHRPQWTINRWDKPDEQKPWAGVEQMTRTGTTYYIPRERLWYSAENTLSDQPDGVGMLRLLAEPVRVLQLYEKWEGIGFQTDLRGMPLLRAPLAKLQQQAVAAGCKKPEEIKAYITAQVKFMQDFLTGHNKTPEQGLLIDSATYTSLDQAQSPSSVYEWAMEIVSSAVSGMPEVGTAIGRLTRDCARIMCAEWLMLGGEDSGGAYSMHEDKTAMFGLVVNSANEDIAMDGGRDLCARLVGLNGLDPETCTPTLVVEPVATQAVEAACRSLLMISQAGLKPGDKAENVLRSRMDLPDAPEVSDAALMMPRTPELRSAPPPLPGAKPVSDVAPEKDEGTMGNRNANVEEAA